MASSPISGLLAALAPEQEPKEEEAKEPISVEAVQKRLEELLSKQNLAEDVYIQQNMNAQMYIPLTILAQHHSLCVLGDVAEIIAAAREAAQLSDKFGVDEDGQMLRPLLKPRRNTLILHGLPEAFPEDELKELFEKSPESENFSSIKPDVNNTAFVSFKTDEAAQNAALWLRSQKLQGSELKCSIKSEHFVRSFFPATGPQACSPYMSPNQAWGYPPWMPVQGWGGAQGDQFSDPAMGWDGNWMPEGIPMGNSGKGKGDWPAKGDGKGKDGKGKGKGGKGKRNRGALGGSFADMESNSDYASPHLPPMEPEGGIEGLPEPGYTHEYRKYSRQYIIEVCNTMEDIVKPESYERCEQNDVALFRSSPCKDWAPLPTPMATFASSFFGDDRRGSDMTEGDTEQKGGKGRKASWGPKGRSNTGEGHEHEETDWAQHGDSSWWAGGDSKRSGKTSWDKSWDYNKNADAGYGQQHWVKKDDKKEEAEKEESSGPRKMSWADKVKNTPDQSDRSQKWVAKKASDEKMDQNKDSAADSGNQQLVSESTSPAAAAAAPAAAVAWGQAEADPSVGATKDAAASSTPTWADKVRKGSGSK